MPPPSSAPGVLRRTVTWLNDHSWVYLAVGWLGLVLVFTSIDLEPDWLNSALMGGFCGIGAVVGASFLARADGRAAGVSKEQLAELERQLHRGEAPEGEREREAMRGLVTRRSHRLRRRAKALPVLFVLLAGFCVLMVLAVDPPYSLLGLLLAAVLAGAEIWGFRRTRGCLDRMHLALSEPAGTPPGEPAKTPRDGLAGTTAGEPAGTPPDASRTPRATHDPNERN